METNLAEAERRIEEARRIQAEHLDLGDLALRELPAGLGSLQYLKALCLGLQGVNDAGKRADRVVAVISEKYLRSTYCMHEIYRLWQRCQEDANELSKCLVSIVLPEVKIGNLEERAVYQRYWVERARKLEALLRDPDLNPGPESVKEVRLVREFAQNVDGILAYLQDVLMSRDLEAHLADDFQAVREALRRRVENDESMGALQSRRDVRQ